jgi:hypothetical protein
MSQKERNTLAHRICSVPSFSIGADVTALDGMSQEHASEKSSSISAKRKSPTFYSMRVLTGLDFLFSLRSFFTYL